jgi:hypothetical protein
VTLSIDTLRTFDVAGRLPVNDHAAGYAKIMCSAAFVSGIDPDFAAENLGLFIASAEPRASPRTVADSVPAHA